MRRAGRLALLAFFLFGAVLALLLIGALVPRGDVLASSGAAEAREIVLLPGPIHTDIALPATPDVLERLGFLTQSGLPLDHPELGAILVGWGGRTFYTATPRWADLTLHTAFRSLTVDDSVLRFELIPALPEDLPRTRRIGLAGEEFERLLRFVEETLARDGEGRPVPVAEAGFGPFDRFFEARGRFNALLGCNTWTAAALARAGEATGLWTPLPQTLLLSMRWHGVR